MQGDTNPYDFLHFQARGVYTVQIVDETKKTEGNHICVLSYSLKIFGKNYVKAEQGTLTVPYRIEQCAHCLL